MTDADARKLAEKVQSLNVKDADVLAWAAWARLLGRFLLSQPAGGVPDERARILGEVAAHHGFYGDVPENSRMDSAHHADRVATGAPSGTGVGRMSLPSVSPGLREELAQAVRVWERGTDNATTKAYDLADAIIALLNSKASAVQPATERRIRALKWAEQYIFSEDAEELDPDEMLDICWELYLSKTPEASAAEVSEEEIAEWLYYRYRTAMSTSMMDWAELNHTQKRPWRQDAKDWPSKYRILKREG